MNRKVDLILLIAPILLIASLIYLYVVERNSNIAKDQTINQLRTELIKSQSKNAELGMVIEGYENKLSKFHIENLEQVGLKKKEEE